MCRDNPKNVPRYLEFDVLAGIVRSQGGELA